MKFQVLMSTMNQKDNSIITKTKITSNAIIINQTDKNDKKIIMNSGKKIVFISNDQRGVGKSRNTALLESTADICLIADDDIEYVENYENIILREFAKNPKADAIIFNIDILRPHGFQQGTNKEQKINKLNFMKHGGPKIAFKRKKILRENIYFSLLFGGGAKYGSGEDSLFIKQMVDSGLRVYSVKSKIGYIDNRESTWFTGFNEKYLYDRGALFKALFPKFWRIICLQFLLRHHKLFKDINSSFEKWNIMKKGAAEFEG